MTEAGTDPAPAPGRPPLIPSYATEYELYTSFRCIRLVCERCRASFSWAKDERVPLEAILAWAAQHDRAHGFF